MGVAVAPAGMRSSGLLKKKLPRALSLMEVIFVLGMLSTVLVIVFTVIIGGLRMQERAELVEQGSSLAREQIEEIKAHPFSIKAGTFDGRAGDTTVDDFPPSPYPSAHRGRELWLKVEVESQDERLWYIRVTTSSEEEQMSSLETVIPK